MKCLGKELERCKNCNSVITSYSQMCLKEEPGEGLPDWTPEPKEAVGLKIKVNPNPPTKEQAESDARYCAEQRFKYNF